MHPAQTSAGLTCALLLLLILVFLLAVVRAAHSLSHVWLSGGAQGTKDFIANMGLGMIADQLADLKLGELLDTPPPGLDEAVAIAKVWPARSMFPVLQGCCLA